MKDPNEILRSWKEIARFLGVSIRSARAFKRRHNMPVARLGRKLFALQEDIIRWISNMSHK